MARSFLACFVLVWLACGCAQQERSLDAATRMPQQASEASEAPAAESSSRGEYLVRHVLACGECHTPRLADGSQDETRLLSGVACSESPAAIGGRGCLPAPNLTPHATGIDRYDDAQLTRLIFQGARPDGRALSATAMPYYLYGAARPQDAAAIVAYLRALPAVDHAILQSDASQWQIAAPVEPSDLPEPNAEPSGTADLVNGRYLVTLACVGCHTPFVGPADRSATQPLELRRALTGGRPFVALAKRVLSPNLTPDATGLAAWSFDDIVRALRQGVDTSGRTLCAPMPSVAFSGITASDAADIAAYLQALPALANPLPHGCATEN